MSVILAQGGGGSGGGVGVQLANVNILDTATEVIDSVALADGFSVKWFLTLENTTDSIWLTEDVKAMHKGGITAIHNVSQILGDNIKHSVSAVINGANLELQITNTDGATITVDAVRIQVLA